MIIKCPFCKKKMEPMPSISPYGLCCRCVHGAIKAVTISSGDGDLRIKFSSKENSLKVECYYRSLIPLVLPDNKELYFNAGIIKDKSYLLISTIYETSSLEKCLGSLDVEEIYNRYLKLTNLS